MKENSSTPENPHRLRSGAAVADINKRDAESGNTPLGAAARNGHGAIVAELLAAGARVDQVQAHYF